VLDLLKDVRVLDLTTVVLGPMATQTLADLGADVIKVESPAGDLARAAGSRSPEDVSAVFANNNRNKRSIVLDLKSDAARTALEALVKTADVFVHNVRPQAMERLGFGPDRLLALNAKLIYVAAVGFGGAGPYGGRPAYDDVIQAASGFAALPQAMGQAPSYAPSIVADKVTALYTVQAVLAGLLRRERSGHGMRIEVPMFESLVSFVMNEHLDAATFATDGAPGYARLLNPNRRPYRTADGWIAVLPYSRDQWVRVLEELGRNDVARAAWLASDAERNARVVELYGILAETLVERSTAAWVATFQRLDVPCTRVASLEEVLADPHLDAVGFFAPTDDLPGRVRSVAQPIAFHGAASRRDRRPPALGEHTEEVLAEAGLTAAEIEALKET